jgi:hypothetical protein
MQNRHLITSGMVLGLVVTMGMSARAELLKNLKTDGSIQVRAFSIENETDRDSATDDHRGEARTRVMVGAGFDLLDDVHARLLLRKNNYVYGGGGENANTIQSNLVLDNAFVRIDKVFGRVDMTMGRQFYGDPNDLVIFFGPQNDDVLSVTALDIFRADADLWGFARLQGIAGKLADTGAIGVNSDTDLYGVSLMNETLLPKTGIGASWYTQKNKGAGATANNTINVLQLLARGDVLDTGLGYHLEYGQNFGRNAAAAGAPANDGNELFAGLNYGRNIGDNMPIRAMVEWGRGTNDWTPIAAGKRFGIIWGQHTTSGAAPSNLIGVGGPGLTNLQVLDGGLGINVTPKLGFDVNVYRFSYDDAAGLSDDEAGMEYDLIASWKHSDNVSFEASAATFQVGDGLRNAAGTGTSPITRLGADVKIKF